MQRFKLMLVLLVLFVLVLFPSRSVFALDRNLSGMPDWNARASMNAQVNAPFNAYLEQEPQATPEAPPYIPPEITPDFPQESVSENNLDTSGAMTESSLAGASRIFLPMLAKPQPYRTYYVSPNGNDSNLGTYDKPWRTIQKAANILVAGDTVKILPGTYYEKFSPKNSGNPGSYITYTAEPGTVVIDGSGVYLSAYEGLVQILGKSYIRVQNLTIRDASVNCVTISTNSSGTRSAYIQISGLSIQNCDKVGILARSSDHLLLQGNQINHINYSSGIGVWWSSDVTVDTNTITNAHYYHACQGAYDEALTISGTNYFEVNNNTLDNTEPNPPGYCSMAEKLGIDIKESSQNGRVHHNTIHHMNAAGIYVDGWHAGANGTPTLNHIDIYQNLVSDGGGITVGCEQSDGIVEYINIYNNLVLNAAFSGIQIRGAYGDGQRKNINIYNNTVYGALPEGGNGGAGIYITTSHLGSNNGDAPVIIRNNISMFYFLSSGSGTMGQILAGNSTIAGKIVADHNMVFGPQKCSYDFPSCVEVGPRAIANPKSVFTNPTMLDLHLNSGSPAINTGLPIGIVAVDYEGNARPQPSGQAYDIGAYEFK